MKVVQLVMKFASLKNQVIHLELRKKMLTRLSVRYKSKELRIESSFCKFCRKLHSENREIDCLTELSELKLTSHKNKANEALIPLLSYFLVKEHTFFSNVSGTFS